MTRPPDIPQWAWDGALAIYNGLHAVGLYNPEESLADYEKAEDVGDIARALLSAYERGRGEREGNLETLVKEADHALDYIILCFNSNWIEGQVSGEVIADLHAALEPFRRRENQPALEEST